ncbi:SDR family NAD(P)-dependent oxidoreductase [Clostridium sp. SHJSY1]|uniref:SDR family NAD(P)-dependent oxidoreductase n=1 Tax=Clostridium sp. SHJSY1 TaxID=2942483 RepID=UPI002876C6A5|nr:SDR family NAD(P)-dependent oxidoreductase [Clostridium sp. SHJSY1]MDS0528455.1 SDR family NAD(P)-dependent oxidoreductase [Clostridium sp. SHJSY1]
MENKKVALITGAGAGIGKAITFKLAEDGYQIAVNSRTEAHANEVYKVLSKNKVNCISVPADVSDENQVKLMVKKVYEKFGRIDILINNAGICPIRTMDKVTVKDIQETFNVNVISMMLCVQAVLPIMIKQGGGKILNASSQASFGETPVSFEYTTTKWAVRGMTREMAISLARYNITVNAYCPGVVYTNMQDNITKETSKIMNVTEDYFKEYRLKQIPLNRFTTCEDVAELVSFMAGKGSNNMTGQSILVNGGQIMV